jgi:hypothetical protein
MKYLLWINEKDEGPFDKAQIAVMLLQRTITKKTLCLPEDGNGEWQPVGMVPELLDRPRPEVWGPVEGSLVAMVLMCIGLLELLCSVIAGLMVGALDSATSGWVVFAGGVISGLLLIGFARIIDHTYESAQRLRRMEALLQNVRDEGRGREAG